MTDQTPDQPTSTNPGIYLGTDGAYHDDTDANREQFPAAEDQVEPNPAPADTPEAATGATLGADTVSPAGDQAGPGDTTLPGPAAAPAPAPKDSEK